MFPSLSMKVDTSYPSSLAVLDASSEFEYIQNPNKKKKEKHYHVYSIILARHI